jgi:hypothetical protein
MVGGNGAGAEEADAADVVDVKAKSWGGKSDDDDGSEADLLDRMVGGSGGGGGGAASSLESARPETDDIAAGIFSSKGGSGGNAGFGERGLDAGKLVSDAGTVWSEDGKT